MMRLDEPTPAEEIRDALAATLAHGMAGMTCMDTHDARAFLADRDQWKARADKAEAALRTLADAVDADDHGRSLLKARDAARAILEQEARDGQ